MFCEAKDATKNLGGVSHDRSFEIRSRILSEFTIQFFLVFFLYQIRRGVRDARKKLQSKDFSWLKKKLRRTFAYYNTNMLQ